MHIFSKKEVNTGRQFEFDFAKAICILGMVFVHCFEEFTKPALMETSSLYYTFVVVLDAIFGAGTFMICLGIGLVYTKKNNPNDFIKRGIFTFFLGYILNFLRFVIPFSFDLLFLDAKYVFSYLLSSFLYSDILQFAGLSFILFGLLKKIKMPDWGIALIAITMSVVASFARFIEVGNVYVGELLGLFAGITQNNGTYPYYAPFALIHWFLFVVVGYLFGKLLKRVENIEAFYAITTPISAVIIAIYMIFAIPNRYGMMSGDLKQYFQMTTLEAIIIVMGSLFIFGVYHYISKLFNNKVKSIITTSAININKIYCIHWIIIGILTEIVLIVYPEGLETYVVLIIATIIYLVSSVLAELIRRKSKKNKQIDEKKENYAEN